MTKAGNVGGRGQGHGVELLGRGPERSALDALLAAVRAGESRVLVLHGPAGVGKSALLDHAVTAAAGLQVLRTAGLAAEAELSYAALHRLCFPLFDRLPTLPSPQRAALETVFGTRDGRAPERFLVALAVLGLLSDASAGVPLLCVVDDAQWLDRPSAQVLGFVARRLLAESVGLVMAARDHAPDLLGLPELGITGLPEADARALLRSVTHGPFDQHVLDRVVAESRGNPLALRDLPQGRPLARLAGGFALPSADAAEDPHFDHRIAVLPDPARMLLLIAAAEPVGDPALVWRGADRLGVTPAAALGAGIEGLLVFGVRVTFAHPLARSAAYRTASDEDRRRVHRVLAELTDRRTDPDRRAWHLAAAASAPDETVAVALEQAAGRAHDRGGLAAVAAFRRRAVALSADPARRAERAAAAADAGLRAGDLDAARSLVALAEREAESEFVRARAQLVRGRLGVVEGAVEAPSTMLAAARRLEPFDLDLAREAYLQAWAAAARTGHSHAIRRPDPGPEDRTGPSGYDGVIPRPAGYDGVIPRPAEQDRIIPRSAGYDPMISRPAEYDPMIPRPAEYDRMTPPPAGHSRAIPRPAEHSRAVPRGASRAVSPADRILDAIPQPAPTVGPGLAAVCRAVPPPAAEPGLVDLVLTGYARLVSDGPAEAVPVLRRAAAALAARPIPARWGWLAGGVGATLWDDGVMRDTLARAAEAARAAGALTDLPRSLVPLALVTAWTGEFDAAGRLAAEASEIGKAIGVPADPDARLLLAALRGDGAAAPGPVGHWTAAVLGNGLARYEQALGAARAAAGAADPWIAMWALPELVEAAVRTGDGELAGEALTGLLDATEPCATDWARGIAVRCRALVSEGAAARALYAEAVDRLGRTRLRPELARAHLLYGEWLRRRRQRVDARVQLRTAYEMFGAIGMAGFAERARRELLATGETARRRTPEAATDGELTAQERQIALLVRDGLSNPEVGARLFLSPRTVEWHLRKVFAKLGIGSRRQLREALPPWA